MINNELPMKIIKVGICFLIAFGELHYFYPWKTYFYNFSYGWWITMWSYLILALIMGIIGAVLVPVVLHRKIYRDVINEIWINIFAIFCVLAIMAVLWGPMGWINIPRTRLFGIFFSEMKFLNFIFFVAPPFAFISSIINIVSKNILTMKRAKA